MQKIVTFALVAGGALALTACGAKKEEAPAEPMAAETMAPVEPTDEAAAAADGLDPTGNPIGPLESAPAADAMAAETPAAE